MPETPTEEVRLRLVAEDEASSTIKSLEAGLDKLGVGLGGGGGGPGMGIAARLKAELPGIASAMKGAGGADIAGGAMAALTGTLAIAAASAAAVGAALTGAYYAGQKLAEVSLEAAVNDEKQVKAMRGVLMLIDGGAHSMRELTAYAGELHEEFEGAAIQMGVAASSLDEAFGSMMERGGISSERAKELAQDMALVGKLTRGGMDGLAQGFSMMELGMVRARNPVVQLIAATHELKGNAHAVAAQLQKMTPEKQMEVAERAIAKQAEMMRKSGAMKQLSLPALEESFKGLREMSLKEAGKPLLAEIVPQLNLVQQFLVEHAGEIRAYAHEVGEVLAAAFRYVASALGGVYDGVRRSWGFISSQFEEVFGDMFRAWRHAGDQTAAIRGMFEKFTENLLAAFAMGMRLVKGLLDAASMMKDVFLLQKPGTGLAQTQESSAQQAVREATNAADMPGVEKAIDKYRELAKAAGVSADQIEQNSAGMRRLADANMKAGDSYAQALDKGNYNFVSHYLDDAVKSQNEAVEKYAFSLIAGSEDAQRALLAGGIHIAGGMDDLMKTIDSQSPELAEKLRHMLAGAVGKEGVVAAPQVNFNGNIHITQDFREQDPDRVALSFRRDLTKQAVARVQGRLSSPFGF